MPTATKKSLTPGQKRVLDATKAKPSYNSKQISELLHISHGSVRTTMSKLRSLGYLPKGKPGRPKGSTTKRGTTRRTTKATTLKKSGTIEGSESVGAFQHLSTRIRRIDKRMVKLTKTIETAAAHKSALLVQKTDLERARYALASAGRGATAAITRHLPR